MLENSFTLTEIKNFLQEILDSDLALEIFLQLTKQGGGTAKSLSKTLTDAGLKASLTRVYEELNSLQQLGLVKNVSKRPSIYMTVLSREILEPLALGVAQESREELMRKWGIIYPFLPPEMVTRSNQIAENRIKGIPIINFISPPIVNIYQNKSPSLKQYILKIFDSPVIYVSHTLLDLGVTVGSIPFFFEQENYVPILNIIEKNYKKHGTIIIKILVDNMSMDLKKIPEIVDKNKPYPKMFSNLIIEVRKPTTPISSFIMGKNHLLLPIGVAGLENFTSSVMEIRDIKLIKKAQILFEKAWKQGNQQFKIEKGNLELFVEK